VKTEQCGAERPTATMANQLVRGRASGRPSVTPLASHTDHASVSAYEQCRNAAQHQIGGRDRDDYQDLLRHGLSRRAHGRACSLGTIMAAGIR
jgi:hypothetical protein